MICFTYVQMIVYWFAVHSVCCKVWMIISFRLIIRHVMRSNSGNNGGHMLTIALVSHSSLLLLLLFRHRRFSVDLFRRDKHPAQIMQYIIVHRAKQANKLLSMAKYMGCLHSRKWYSREKVATAVVVVVVAVARQKGRESCCAINHHKWQLNYRTIE